MKTVTKVMLGVMITSLMFLAPAQSKAGGPGDLLKDHFGKHDQGKRGDHDGRGDKGGKGDKDDYKKPDNDSWSTGNGRPTSIPLDGGLLLLFAAGLGLGAKLIYDRNRPQPVSIFE